MKLSVSWLTSAILLALGVWVGLYINVVRDSRTVANAALQAVPAVTAAVGAPPAAAAAKSKSILFMFASYKDVQFLYTQKALDAMRDHCNAGYNVTVAIQATDYLTYESQRFKDIRRRMFCARTGADIPIWIDNYGLISFGLNSKNREVIRKHIDEFDYFVYLEEDMVLTVSHTAAYLAAMNDLRRRLPHTWSRYFIGFLRYEDSTSAANFPLERITWEYSRQHVNVVNISGAAYVVTTNINQAMFFFTQAQVRDLQSRCDFLSNVQVNGFYGQLRSAMNKEWKYMAAGVSEWYSSFQPVLQCGMRRVVPVQGLQLFMVHHSTNKAQVRRSKEDLLTMGDWDRLVTEKAAAGALMTVEEVYNKVVFEQFNLHLLDRQRLAADKIKWSYNEGFEE